MRRMTMAAILFILAAPSLAAAAGYRWLDDAGVAHFTDDPDRIPDRYLERATELDPGSAGRKPEAAAPNAPKPVEPAAAPASGAAAGAPAATAPDGSDKSAKVASELRQVRESLADKRKELARLLHKWNVARGRTPTLEEAKEFQKRLAEGKATDKDNPYINRNSLSSSGRARAAYYKKLDEVRQDQAHARRLEQELEALR